MMYDLTEHLVELLENEKWKEIPEFQDLTIMRVLTGLSKQ